MPEAVTLPPSSPARGPISTKKSAARMASSSCSTTITVLPMSRRRVKVSSKRSLSRWCNPIDGSSSTYITPVKPEPICEARRIRWDSPPDRLPDCRDKVKYSSPTLFKNCRRVIISFKILCAISRFCGESCSSTLPNHCKAFLIDISEACIISKPQILTAKASGFKRLPPQASHGAADW